MDRNDGGQCNSQPNLNIEDEAPSSQVADSAGAIQVPHRSNIATLHGAEVTPLVASNAHLSAHLSFSHKFNSRDIKRKSTHHHQTSNAARVRSRSFCKDKISCKEKPGARTLTCTPIFIYKDT